MGETTQFGRGYDKSQGVGQSVFSLPLISSHFPSPTAMSPWCFFRLLGIAFLGHRAFSLAAHLLFLSLQHSILERPPLPKGGFTRHATIPTLPPCPK